MIFGLAIAFWSLLPKEGTKNFVCGPAFRASLVKLWDLAGFLFWGFTFGGLELFGARRCLDPTLKQEQTPHFGAWILKSVWGL
jgi:hypothetical protein